MKKTVKKRDVRQEATTAMQLVLPAVAEMRGALMALVVEHGLRVVAAMIEGDRERLCGARYAHDADRKMSRHGYAPGELVLGGRRVSMQRPRVRSRAGGEARLPSWEALACEDPLHERAVEQMLVGVTTRKYERSLDAMPETVKTRGTSKSAVSRRFVQVTEARVAEALSRDLSNLVICTVMIDGLVVGDHTVLIALGIDENGGKHVLGLREGATENAAACTTLLTSLRERGLPTERATLFVIDGSKALSKAIRDVFGARAVVQRCTVHKVRNVQEHLPEAERARVATTMRGAYRSGDAAQAKRVLTGLARQLDKKHPSAAASIREGLDETLTLLRLGVTGALLRTLSTTNAIENLNGLLRTRIRNVKRWQGGSMILRWLVTALDDAAMGFRRIRGHQELRKLVTILRDHDTKLDAVDGVTHPNKAA